MSNMLMIASGIMAFIAFCGLEGGGLTCTQALLILIPAMLILAVSFRYSSLYEPAEMKGTGWHE